MRNSRESNKQIGRIVMVHPALTTDPADMRGEVGRIIEDNGEDVVVEFADKIKGRYTYEAVVVLATYQHMLDYLLKYYDSLSGSSRRAVLQMMKLQADGKERQALTILTLFPALALHCTRFYSEIKEQVGQVKGKQNRQRL